MVPKKTSMGAVEYHAEPKGIWLPATEGSKERLSINVLRSIKGCKTANHSRFMECQVVIVEESSKEFQKVSHSMKEHRGAGGAAVVEVV